MNCFWKEDSSHARKDVIGSFSPCCCHFSFQVGISAMFLNYCTTRYSTRTRHIHFCCSDVAIRIVNLNEEARVITCRFSNPEASFVVINPYSKPTNAGP